MTVTRVGISSIREKKKENLEKKADFLINTNFNFRHIHFMALKKVGVHVRFTFPNPQPSELVRSSWSIALRAPKLKKRGLGKCLIDFISLISALPLLS